MRNRRGRLQCAWPRLRAARDAENPVRKERMDSNIHAHFLARLCKPGLRVLDHLVPPLLLVLLRRRELGILVRPPREAVAVEAEDLALPLPVAAAPRLNEVVLLRVQAPARQAAAE